MNQVYVYIGRNNTGEHTGKFIKPKLWNRIYEKLNYKGYEVFEPIKVEVNKLIGYN